MAGDIVRKSSQLWVPVFDIAVSLKENNPHVALKTIGSHMRPNNLSSNMYSPSVLKSIMKDRDSLRFFVTNTGWMAQCLERWIRLSSVVGSNPTLAINSPLVTNKDQQQ
jgi:hypothetical protein